MYIYIYEICICIYIYLFIYLYTHMFSMSQRRQAHGPIFHPGLVLFAAASLPVALGYAGAAQSQVAVVCIYTYVNVKINIPG